MENTNTPQDDAEDTEDRFEWNDAVLIAVAAAAVVGTVLYFRNRKQRKLESEVIAETENRVIEQINLES